MKRTRLFVPVVLLLLILFATNLVQASPNWMPLPPVAGGDPGEGQNSWFPVLQVSCDTVSIVMTAPDFFFINSAGYQAVEWRFNELRMYNPATRSETMIATTPDAAYGIDSRSIGVFTGGGLQTATFSIDTPLAAGSRVYGTLQFRRQPMGDPQNRPPYEAWDATIFKVGDFTWKADHFLRAYEPAYSVSPFGEAVELSCDPAYDLNNGATNPPTISLDANGNPSEILEGTSGVQQFTYNLVLSAPSSRTITAHVSVGGDGGNRETRPSSGWTDWEDANEEGVDHNVLNVATSLDYRVDYPFNCGTGTSYCDLGIDAQPSFMHEIVFAPGQTVKSFTVEVYGDTIVEHDQPITIHINDVSHAIISKGQFSFNDLSLTILDDDEPTITPSSASVTMNECGVGNGVQSAPFNLNLVMNHAIDFNIGLYHFTYPDTATDNVDYVKIASEPMSSPPFVNLTIPAGQTSVTIPVRIIGDNVAEDDETFTLELINGIVEYEVVTPSRTEISGYDPLPGKLATNSITVTIPANGPAATLSNGSMTEGDSGQTNMTFTVTLAELAKDQNGSNRAVTIAYQTGNGSAIAGQDYIATSGQVTIPAGQLSATINVPIIGDLQPEATEETFSLQLTGSDGACLPGAASTGIITDNDYLQNLTVNGDTSVAPLDLTFSWDQPQGIDPTVSWYHLVVRNITSAVYDQWHKGTDICSGTSCGVNILDQAPYEFANGNYTWDVSAWVNGATFTSEKGGSAFSVNIGIVPEPYVVDVVANAGLPTVNWSSDAPTEWYQVYITSAGSSTILFKKWVQKGTVCNGAQCSLNTTMLLGQGNYLVYVKGYGPQSQFSGTPIANLPLSDPYAFNINLNMNVGGNVSLGQPTFFWDADGEATWYHLHVQTAGGVTRFDKWYKAADLGCSGGGTCNVAPPVNLSGGDHSWWIQSWGPGTWNNNSSGFRSYGPNFSVSTTPPAQITGLNVQYENSGRPLFTWAHDINATYYQFVVRSDASGVLLNKWYKRTDLGCTDDNTCSAPQTLNLKAGGHKWWVRAWGPGGFNNGNPGLWSGSTFVVAPGPSTPPTGMSPTGLTSAPPTFTWTAPNDISWYHLEVQTADGAMVVHRKWYAADVLGCAPDGSTCSVTPLPTLAAGAYRWRVRTYNPTGISAWSAWVEFTSS